MIPFGPPPAIFPFFGYRSTSRLRIGARALRRRPARWDHGSTFAKTRALLSHFASREFEGLEVTMEIRGPAGDTREYRSVTDKEGYVLFDITLPGWPMPAHTEWETVTLSWNDGDQDRCAEGYVLVPGREADLAIISDIDDTIIETGITGGIRSVLRNWRRILQQMPSERVQVPGADSLYSTLGGGITATDKGKAGRHLPATRHPFFYVSSSPWNLFSYLVAFMESRGLPIGPLELRDWGLNRETFGSAGHSAHKAEAIARLLDAFPETRFALMGDDTQGDLVAFGKVARERQGRIAAIFIRKAGEAHSAEELAARKAIADAGVPLWMGARYDVGMDFLKTIGLNHDHNAGNIARQIARPDDVTADETVSARA